MSELGKSTDKGYYNPHLLIAGVLVILISVSAYTLVMAIYSFFKHFHK
jgi:hypothetical protein